MPGYLLQDVHFDINEGKQNFRHILELLLCYLNPMDGPDARRTISYELLTISSYKVGTECIPF